MRETYIDKMSDVLSSCCKVPICDEKLTPYCSSCRHSYNLVVICQKCKGKGEYLGESNEMTGCDCDNGYIYWED